MKYLRFNIILSLFILPISLAFAGEKVNQRIEVPHSEKLFIDITRGFVKVKSWDKSEISVQGELDDSVSKLIFKNKKHKTLLKVVAQDGEHWGDSSVLKVFVPESTQVIFKGVDTTFSFNKIYAGISGKSITGDIQIKDARASLSISTMSGDVHIEKAIGKVEVESVSGEIDVSGQFEKAALKSMSGNISATIGSIDKLKIKNISGDIEISGEVQPNAEIKLASVNGNIHFNVDGKLNAVCELVSQFGGSIENSITDDVPQESMMQQQLLNFTSGDGSGKIIMKTISGKITIEE